MMNVKEEEDCKFRLYETQRLLSLKQTVGSFLESSSSPIIKEKLGILLHNIESLQLCLQSHCFGPVLCNETIKILEHVPNIAVIFLTIVSPN